MDVGADVVEVRSGTAIRVDEVYSVCRHFVAPLAFLQDGVPPLLHVYLGVERTI